jgi:CheY-like chemotaxis protein
MRTDAAGGAPKVSAPKSLLVVDSDQTMPNLIRACLPKAHWRIEFAQDSSEALNRLSCKPYDLVLTGLRTTGLQNIELLRQMRSLQPRIKMIVLTTQSTPEEVIKSIRAHAFSHLSEPIDGETLGRLIEEALKRPWDDGIDVLSARPDWLSLRLKCRRVTAERLLQFMQELRVDLPESERVVIGTAFREMLLNAMEHGAHFDSQKTVDVIRIRTPEIILYMYMIRGPGRGFPFDSLPHAAVSNPASCPFDHVLYREEQGMRPGGFMILLTQGLMDRLLYNEQGNEVLFIKYLNAKTPRAETQPRSETGGLPQSTKT